MSIWWNFRKIFFIALCGFALLFAEFLYFKANLRPLVPLQNMTLSEKQNHWEMRIRASGGPPAYAEFAEAVESYPPIEKHEEGHIFGDSLFAVLGLDGISTCDGRFLYACFHSFMIRAVSDLGTTSAQRLYEACERELGNTSGECEHGIGHGLLGAFGAGTYTFEHLEKALAICDSLAPASRYCMGGVFMEYNMRSMNSGEMSPRRYDAKEILEPCESIDLAHRASCSFWLPLWWNWTDPDRNDSLAMAGKMGRRCMELSSEREVRERCIESIGNVIQGLTDETPARTRDVCSRVSSDAEYRYLCHLRSAERFMYYYPLEKSLEACDGLPDAYTKRCRDQATSETGLRRADMARGVEGIGFE